MPPMQASSGSSASISMHGCEETSGRLNVACAEATPLARQTRTTRTLSDAAISAAGRPPPPPTPNSESTRSAEIPAEPSGALLGQLRIAVTQRPQRRQEKERLSEDAGAGESQRIVRLAMVLLVQQDGREFLAGEQLQG